MSMGGSEGLAESASVAAPVHIGGFAVTASISGTLYLDHLQGLVNGDVIAANASFIELTAPPATVSVYGSGFSYGYDGSLLGGSITEIDYVDSSPGGLHLTLAFTSGVPVSVLSQIDAGSLDPSALVSGPEQLSGSAGAETLHGGASDDVLAGFGGADQLYGGAGNDIIYAAGLDGQGGGAAGATYLRGEDGDDWIQGGSGFDDINGNKGQDTIDGGSGGDDWLVGGQGNDLITAHAGGNILYGNLGSDTLTGGSGAEILRGGQGDDSVVGGAGNDWISGDRGSDTVSGGAGADVFHTFSGAGIDQVTDFNAADGDRVQLDPGTTYTVSQVGADTVIDMGNGDKMVLAGVTLSTLPQGWIFGA